MNSLLTCDLNGRAHLRVTVSVSCFLLKEIQWPVCALEVSSLEDGYLGMIPIDGT